MAEKTLRRSAMEFVILIGVVSLFADMTYQGAHGNAGPFLALLGASGTVVGLVAGSGELVNYTLRLLFGWWADRSGRYWTILFIGYTVNLLVVPLLALAGHWPTAALLLILERAGKGIRTPVRDAMLSHAAEEVGHGRAFGIHEALDQTGGILGPLLVAGVLFTKNSYPASFAILAIPALAALAVLVRTWRTYPTPEHLEQAAPGLEAKEFPVSFWIFLAGAGCLAAGYADFALMAFHLKMGGVAGAAIPLAYAAAMGLQGLASYVLGKCYDRWSVRALVGAVIPAAGFAPLVFLGGPGEKFFGIALWALGMGAQGSIIKAFVAQTIPAGSRGSAYGVLQSSYGVCWFAGSALLGWFYDRSLTALVIFSVLAQLTAIPLFLAVEKKLGRPVVN